LESRICPVTLKEAQQFVLAHHRHCSPTSGHKFSVGLEKRGRLIGVVTAGRPIARANDDGYTLEITRCCVIEGNPNANSKLYAAALRAARAMGFRRVFSYTLPSESGSSLKAVGFQYDGMTKDYPNGWDMPSRPRKKPARYPNGPKIRWCKVFSETKKPEKEGMDDMSMGVRKESDNGIWNVIDPRLGTVPDEEIVSFLGLTSITVGDIKRRREALGISHCMTADEMASRREEVDRLLGTMPDAWIAKMLGYSRQRISQIRARKKIPVYKKRQ
jgi:hypothetical protein